MIESSKLLLDEYPLIILPKLAVEIGLNEAVILQQMNYWLLKSDKIKDNKKWTYGSYEYWSEQFPFWSVSTIRRTISNLEKKNLIISANYNRAGFDKTKWYTINYEELELVNRRCAQNEQTSCPKRTDEDTNMNKPIPETSSETSSDKVILSSERSDEKETENDNKKECKTNVYKEITDYLNDKAGRNFSYKNKSTQSQINGRMSEGRTVDDFKAVIDLKVEQWGNDDKMKNYLRPATLFAPTNFENYINEALTTASKKKSNLPSDAPSMKSFDLDEF